MLHRGRSIPLKNVFATCGLILFLVGIGLGGYLIFCFLESSTLNRSITYNTCPPLQMCSLSTDQLNLETSSTLIRDSDTVHITAHFSTDQEAILSLTAPSFTVNPSEPMLVKPTTTKLDWILSPTKIGTFGIEVKMTDISGHTLLTEQKGIAVVNVLGMNPWQSKILSYAATFLGSMLSSPWLYDWWKEHKKKKYKKKNIKNYQKIVNLNIFLYNPIVLKVGAKLVSISDLLLLMIFYRTSNEV